MAEELNHELPGMLALAEGVASQKWPHTVDAQAWVREWLKTLAEHPELATDEGAMLGWFANAIMAGYDTAQSRATHVSVPREPSGRMVVAAAEILGERDQYVPIIAIYKAMLKAARDGGSNVE